MRSAMSPRAAASRTTVRLMGRLSSAGVRVREPRLALLQESADAFPSLGPDRVPGDGLALEHHLRLERSDRVSDQALARAKGRAGTAREPLRDFKRPRQQLLVGYHLIEQSPGKRLFGPKHAIQQQQLHGALEAERARQQEGGAGV